MFDIYPNIHHIPGTTESPPPPIKIYFISPLCLNKLHNPITYVVYKYEVSTLLITDFNKRSFIHFLTTDLFTQFHLLHLLTNGLLFEIGFLNSVVQSLSQIVTETQSSQKTYIKYTLLL